jgi:hypothetical protein
VLGERGKQVKRHVSDTEVVDLKVGQQYHAKQCIHEFSTRSENCYIEGKLWMHEFWGRRISN